MKKYVPTIVLFSVFLFFVLQILVSINNTDKPKKACCNQTSPNTNQTDDQVILNSLNKFIVSL